jgi:hypothetical protein
VCSQNSKPIPYSFIKYFNKSNLFFLETKVVVNEKFYYLCHVDLKEEHR